MKNPELVIPAGNLEKLRTAVLYGADAVYVGVAGFSLRAGGAEFELADLGAGVVEAHQKGVKVYAALNIFARNHDLASLGSTVKALADLQIDAVIVSEPGMLRMVKKAAPDLAVHLSTQANTTNVEAVRFWKDQGVKRIVLARELNLHEVAEISGLVPEVELELFIHGAMCVAYSGRCFLSALRTGRSSNHGECTHPCRWEHQLVEKTRKEDPFILEEDSRYSYLLSSKDLCMIEYLPEVWKAGVAALKVEGRMKSAYYVAVVTRVYRQAIAELLKNPSNYQCRPEWLAELKEISNRGYTTGFYFTDGPKVNEISPDIKYIQTHELIGTVYAYEPEARRILAGVRNRLTGEDFIELLLPEGMIRLDPSQMTNEEGFSVKIAHNGHRVYFPVDQAVPAGAVIRRAISQYSVASQNGYHNSIDH
jgi:putative protease